MPSFVIEYQIALVLGSFLAGIAGAVAVYRSPVAGVGWRLADLIWVVLGGLGAFAAILAGLYQDDRSLLGRRIDVAYALSKSFEQDAGRFRLIHCEQDGAAPGLAEARTLCDRIEFLHASVSENRALPLFLEVAGTQPRLKALTFLLGGPQSEMADMVATAESFEVASFLSFTARDAETQAASAAVSAAGGAAVAAEFQVLAMAYEELIAVVAELLADWAYLQQNSRLLVLQVIAICLVAFAAPFRLGKSVAELL